MVLPWYFPKGISRVSNNCRCSGFMRATVTLRRAKIRGGGPAHEQSIRSRAFRRSARPRLCHRGRGAAIGPQEKPLDVVHLSPDRGPGLERMAQKYAIRSTDEAAAYLAHPVLGKRLRECRALVLALAGHDIAEIFGSPD